MALTRLPARPASPRLDRRHPLAAGLLFLAAPGDGDLTDHVNGTRGTLLASGTTGGAGPYGRGALASSSTTVGGASWPLPAAVRSIGDRMTVAVLADVDTLTAYSALLSVPYQAGAWANPFHALGLVRDNTGTSGRAVWAVNSGSESFIASAAGLFATGLHLVAFSCGPAGSSFTGTAFYLDGAPHTTDVRGVTPTFGAGATVNLLNRSSYDPGEGTAGRCFLGAIWGRPLSADEHARLAADPFGMLRPPRRTPALLAAAAPRPWPAALLCQF